MKYNVNSYVGALEGTLDKSQNKDVAISNFIKLLKKNGDIKAISKILDKLHKELVKKDGGNWVNIETAREISAQKSDSLKAKFSVKDHIDFKINSVLVAGTRITINEQEELDNSLNTKLKKLFK